MRIVIVCHVFPPEHAPAGVMMRELAEDLSASGHEVTILTGWPNHPEGVLFPGWGSHLRQVEQHEGYRLIRCGHSIHPRRKMFWRMWYYFTFAVSTFWIGLFSGRADAVLCLSTPIFGSWSSWLLAKCKGARFVYDIFDLHPEAAANAGLMKKGLLYRLLRGWDSRLCRWSDAIITLSETLKRNIVERRIEPEKVTVIPFWVDPNGITPVDRDNTWRRKHGIGPDVFVALYAGTLGYVSGAEILVEAAKALKDDAHILLLVVGAGVVKDRIEQRAKEEGLTNMRFLPFQPQEELSLVQGTADVGLVTLLAEAGQTSVPSKVLGYLAAGRAVIAGVAGDSDTAKTILDGKCGLVVASQDGPALARAIAKAAANPEMVSEMGRNARRLLLSKFSRSRCTGSYKEILAGR